MSIDLSSLSRRELDVFNAIAAGKTVCTYRARILKKLQLRSNAEVARLHQQAAVDRASDHSLLASALCAGIARWVAHAPPTTGEIVVGGLRYITPLDAAGCPELHPVMREAIATAMQKHRSASISEVAA